MLPTSVIVELDEMWHYVKKKHNKLWIWKALDHDTGQLIDWECGDRDRATLNKLLLRLEDRGVLVYFTDGYEAYHSEITEEILVQSKALTHGIERNNGRQRHWFARFRRKSIVVSKSLEMVSLTLKLFAAFHVNKTLDMSPSNNLPPILGQNG